MMFRHIGRDLTGRLPEWDASAKLSLGIAVLLLVLLLVLGFLGPEVIQLPARIGAFGLLISIQLLFLWANRRDVSPYHQAQRHFIAQEYRAARLLLEAIPDRGRASVDALVLLGNTYRNLGLFEMCQSALERALEIKPQHALGVFSLGKLQLVRGDYAAACDRFERAIIAGAPEVVRFELGQAHFLLGNCAVARRHLLEARSALADDAAQLLLLQYYLHVLKAGEMPSSGFIGAHLAFWRGEASRYAERPYGRHLAEVAGELGAALTKS
jgi:tetratricopeptide (TPR) repeat protein